MTDSSESFTEAFRNNDSAAERREALEESDDYNVPEDDDPSSDSSDNDSGDSSSDGRDASDVGRGSPSVAGGSGVSDPDQSTDSSSSSSNDTDQSSSSDETSFEGGMPSDTFGEDPDSNNETGANTVDGDGDGSVNTPGRDAEDVDRGSPPVAGGSGVTPPEDSSDSSSSAPAPDTPSSGPSGPQQSTGDGENDPQTEPTGSGQGIGGGTSVGETPQDELDQPEERDVPEPEQSEQGLEETGGTDTQYQVELGDETITGTEQEIAQTVESRLAGRQISDVVPGVRMTGAEFREGDVRVTLTDDGTLRRELTETGRERVSQIRERQAEEQTELQLEEQLNEQFTDADVDVQQVGQGSPQEAGGEGVSNVDVSDDVRREAIRERLADQFGVDEDQIVFSEGGEPNVVSDETDVSPNTGGSVTDGGAREKIVQRLEEQTGAELDRQDVVFEETDDGVRGRLSDEGEVTVARQNAPFQNTPLEGIFAAGSEARVRGEQATDPAAEGFDEATPDQQDVIDALAAAGDDAGSTDIPFTETDFDDADELVPEDDSPEGIGPGAYALQVNIATALTDKSEEEVRKEIAEEVSEPGPATGVGPAIGPSPTGAARGVGALARLQQSGSVARAGAAVGTVVTAAGVREVIEDNDGEVQIGGTPSAEIEIPEEDTTDGELEVVDQQQSELEVGDTFVDSEVEVTTENEQDPIEQLQAAGILIQEEEEIEEEDQREIPLEEIIGEESGRQRPGRIGRGLNRGQRLGRESGSGLSDINRDRVEGSEVLREDDDPVYIYRDLPDTVVPGETTEPAEDVVDRTEEAQQSEVDQPTEVEVGSGQSPWSFVGSDQGQQGDLDLEEAQQPDVEVGQTEAVEQSPVLEQPNVFDDVLDDIFEDTAATAEATDVEYARVTEEVAEEEALSEPRDDIPGLRRLRSNDPDPLEEEFDDSLFEESSEVFDTGVLQNLDEILDS